VDALDVLEDRSVSVPRAASILGIRPTAMHDVLDAGKIPYTTPGVGGQRRVKLSDVYAYRDKVTHRAHRPRLALADDPLRD
jgi:hypothetical protein